MTEVEQLTQEVLKLTTMTEELRVKHIVSDDFLFKLHWTLVEIERRLGEHNGT